MVEGGAELGRTFEPLDLAVHGRRTNAERIGDPMPEKIVKVWPIAVILFRQSEGMCQFADIAIHGEGGTIPVM